jgi:hypothetical protein
MQFIKHHIKVDFYSTECKYFIHSMHPQYFTIMGAFQNVDTHLINRLCANTMRKVRFMTHGLVNLNMIQKAMEDINKDK